MSWFEPDPEAVVQEVWLRVLKGAATYSGQAKVSTWLHRLAVNEGQRALPTQGGTLRTNRELYGPHDQPDRTDQGAPLQEVADPKQALAVLPELLALLTRDQRLVLEVLYIDGLMQAEAANFSASPSGRSRPAPLVLRERFAPTSPPVLAEASRWPSASREARRQRAAPTPAVGGNGPLGRRVQRHMPTNYSDTHSDRSTEPASATGRGGTSIAKEAVTRLVTRTRVKQRC
jgi:hypothetical protein